MNRQEPLTNEPASQPTNQPANQPSTNHKPNTNRGDTFLNGNPGFRNGLVGGVPCQQGPEGTSPHYESGALLGVSAMQLGSGKLPDSGASGTSSPLLLQNVQEISAPRKWQKRTIFTIEVNPSKSSVPCPQSGRVRTSERIVLGYLLRGLTVEQQLSKGSQLKSSGSRSACATIFHHGTALAPNL